MAEAPLASDYTLAELKLLRHVTAKGIQAGSVIGAAAAVPAIRLRTGSMPSLAAVGDWAATGAGVGLGLTLVVGARALAGMDGEGVAARGAKLRQNRMQNRVDYLSAAGAAAMVARAVSEGKADGQDPKKVLGDACVGVATGVLLHVAVSALQGAYRKVSGKAAEEE